MVIVACALAFSGCVNSPPANASASSGRVEVVFDQPERFSDVKSQDRAPVDPDILNQLKADLIRTAAPRIPAGSTLTITFTDIDLAGAFEHWRISTHDVRIFKSVYPPRAQFTWKLTDANGIATRQGTENLIDASYLDQSRIRNDPLYYDKQLLEDWVRRTFR